MSKKTPKYMMISGWLPACYSHYRNLECQWVGFEAFTTDEFYGCMKMIADLLNDGVSKKQIVKKVTKSIEDTDLAEYRPVAMEYFVEEAFTFVSEYFEIGKYYQDIHKETAIYE